MIRYFCDSSEGKIKAEIHSCRYDLVNKLLKRMGADMVPSEVLRVAELPAKITGVARCHPDDIYDEHTGKELARGRVIENYYKALGKAEDRVVDMLCRVMETSGYFETVYETEVEV